MATKDDLGIAERSALLALMVEATEVSNPDLKRRHGIAVRGDEWRRLNDLKLVDSRRLGRSNSHELTDTGWAWCAAELSAGAPSRAGAGGRALYSVLAGLDRYLDRSQLRLSDVFRPAQDGVAPDGRGSDVEGVIRAAYGRLAPGPGEWVGLARLRVALGEIPRAEVDETLTRLYRESQVDLAPESNQKTLTTADRDAALRVGRKDTHLLSIESP